MQSSLMKKTPKKFSKPTRNIIKNVDFIKINLFIHLIQSKNMIKFIFT